MYPVILHFPLLVIFMIVTIQLILGVMGVSVPLLRVSVCHFDDCQCAIVISVSLPL